MIFVSDDKSRQLNCLQETILNGNKQKSEELVKSSLWIMFAYQWFGDWDSKEFYE